MHVQGSTLSQTIMHGFSIIQTLLCFKADNQRLPSLGEVTQVALRYYSFKCLSKHVCPDDTETQGQLCLLL